MWTDAPPSPSPLVAPPAAAPPRVRAAVEYAIRGDLRFLSHHNEIRLLARAMIRAGWPVRFSGGFNPIPKFSIALPRSVAMASERQLALVELSAERPAESLAAALRGQLPAGAALHGVTTPFPLQTPRISDVTYTIALQAGDEAGLPARIAARLEATSWVVPRRAAPGKPAREIDIRPFVAGIALRNGELQLTLWNLASGAARPGEILVSLGLAEATYGHRVCRANMNWTCPTSAPPGPAPAAEVSELEPSRNEERYEDQEHTQDHEEEDLPQRG